MFKMQDRVFQENNKGKINRIIKELFENSPMHEVSDFPYLPFSKSSADMEIISYLELFDYKI